MTLRRTATAVLAIGTLLSLAAGPIEAADFSGFRGPKRDNISTETGLLKQWPVGGPKLLWTAKGLGEGYSTVSIVGGRAYTMGATRAGGESVHAIDLAGGNIVWSTKISSQYGASAGNGPRATPTIDGSRIYAQGLSGDVACLDLESGRIIWQKNVLKTFGGGRPGWAICESVMIDGQKMICTPGGRDATMVALDKVTGDELWRSAVPGNPRSRLLVPDRDHRRWRQAVCQLHSQRGDRSPSLRRDIPLETVRLGQRHGELLEPRGRRESCLQRLGLRQGRRPGRIDLLGWQDLRQADLSHPQHEEPPRRNASAQGVPVRIQ